MLWVSEILLRHHDLACFEDLVAVVQARALDGERFLRMDVRPPFHDTPEDWESRLEAAFTGVVDDR